MNIQFVDYTEEFLLLSKKWLSDPEIKKLTMTPDIDEEKQKLWFDGLKSRDDYYIKGITSDGFPIGAAGIKHISYTDSIGEYWGYIGEKAYIGKGIGKLMITEMLDLGKKLKLKKLYLHVADFNFRAYCLYKKFGFKDVEKIDGVINMEKIL